MKLMKKINRIIVAAALLCSAMMLSACNSSTGGDTTVSGDREYKVAVKDALGNPYTDGVVVEFHKDGKQVALQVVDQETGVATKTLEAGDYTVKLQFTGDAAEYYYEEEEALVQNPSKPKIKRKNKTKNKIALG